MVVPVEWTAELRACLRTAEQLLREHGADQSYARDGAPNPAAKLWHTNQHEAALATAGELRAWRQRLQTKALHRPTTERLRAACEAARSAADALETALDALRPTATDTWQTA